MALSRSRTMGSSVLGHFESENLPQTLVSEIRRFLRVANQIEAEAPRVAYICKSFGGSITCLCCDFGFQFEFGVEGNAIQWL
ncbi:putative callose synthase 8 [Acorus gramineus]|uniref:Callose synthase 8 n=1 Tax=Acorus gramineus TaxID=55184 RepID=A0AAV9A3K1_ACOGR|nr:putative callose synthase 8 [Acorus gramineus]KAK1258814.1 putative callose synthase 8 [Acorus gramineus]